MRGEEFDEDQAAEFAERARARIFGMSRGIALRVGRSQGRGGEQSAALLQLVGSNTIGEESAQRNLNGAKMRPGFEQMRGKGMPRRVRMDRLGEARGLPFDTQEDGPRGEGMDGIGAGEQPSSGRRPARTLTEPFSSCPHEEFRWRRAT